MITESDECSVLEGCMGHCGNGALEESNLAFFVEESILKVMNVEKQKDIIFRIFDLNLYFSISFCENNTFSSPVA